MPENHHPMNLRTTLRSIFTNLKSARRSWGALSPARVKGVALALAVLSFAADASALHGIYKSFVIVSTGGANTYYQVSGGPDNFSGLNLGTLCSTGNLKLQGGEANTFDNAGCNQNTCAGSCCGGHDYVYAAQMFYRVYKQGSTPPGFTQMDLGCRGRGNDGSNNNEKWDQTTQNIDLLSLATSGAGTYNVEVFFRDDDSFDCSGDFQDFD